MTTQVQVTKIGENFMLPLSAEVMQQIGFDEGEEISLTVENKTLVARPLARAALENRVDEIVTNLLEKRKSAYQILAEGA